ncbi:membrane protein insertion efficiency factor YidD [bacterium]|nr:membrane protein insertion efficiency factor YidD [bacterium]
MRFTYLALFIVLSSFGLSAQERMPVDDIKDLIGLIGKNESYSLKNEGKASPVGLGIASELKTAFTGLIWIYQQTLSSQDMAVCNFSPSCSRFGSEALRTAGALKGMCLTSDRLQRCHGLPGQHRHYAMSSDRLHFIDPVTSQQ